MKIVAEKGLVVGEPRCAVYATGRGDALFVVDVSGVKVTVAMSSSEARQFGQGLIGVAAIVDFEASKREPGIVKPNGEGARPIFKGAET